MKLDDPFRNYVEELFAPLGKIRVREMFGVGGVYAGEDLFALIEDDIVYMKVDDAWRDNLSADGAKPFEWTNPDTGRSMQLSFVSLPETTLSKPESAVAWGAKALDAAIDARRAKVKSPRRHAF